MVWRIAYDDVKRAVLEHRSGRLANEPEKGTRIYPHRASERSQKQLLVHLGAGLHQKHWYQRTVSFQELRNNRNDEASAPVPRSSTCRLLTGESHDDPGVGESL